MSETPPTSAPASSSSPAAPAPPTKEIDFSCRLPLLVFFISGAIWLVIASVFGLICSIKFHSPNFLADSPWLTYGRVHQAYFNSLLYGFCVQTGLGVGLWLLARLGRTPLAHRWLVTVGAKFWNLGVTLGVAGILAGDSTGFKNLEMPAYGALITFLGYLFIGIWGVLTFHERRERQLFVSQWFVFTALFWFPWIYSTANLLLLKFPVRGVTQAVIAWWYSDNLVTVWLTLAGLAAVFYLVPKVTQRELHSQYLALFTFWMLILFASWGGIPNTAPVPAWMPAVSTIATVLTLLPLLAAGVNTFQTARSKVPGTPAPASAPGKTDSTLTPPSVLCFALFGVGALVIAGLMRALGVVFDVNQTLHFSWFVAAREQLQIYGFFVMVMFGAIYYILPQLTRSEFPSAKLVKAHFWVAAAGIVLLVLPLAIGGLVQSSQMEDAAIPFTTVMKTSLVFLRVSTMGDLLLFVGHLLFLGNVFALVNRFYKVRVEAAYAEVTSDLYKPAGAKT